MKVYKNEGKFEVLSKTEDIIFQIANAARVCYRSHDKQSEENDLKLVKNLLNRGHYAMIEMAHLTVKFTKTSRGVSHELVRHRLASFAQESTRYVNGSDLHVIVPPHKDEEIHNIGLESSEYDDISLKTWFEHNENTYRYLLNAGYKPEDARQCLPIATEAPIVMSANLREWIHVFEMRTSEFAHWEIRAVMLNLLKWCKKNIPLIFDDFHFFETEDGKEYARKLPSNFKIKDEIKHIILAKPEEKETLLKYIESL